MKFVLPPPNIYSINKLGNSKNFDHEQYSTVKVLPSCLWGSTDTLAPPLNPPVVEKYK